MSIDPNLAPVFTNAVLAQVDPKRLFGKMNTNGNREAFRLTNRRFALGLPQNPVRAGMHEVYTVLLRLREAERSWRRARRRFPID